MKRISQNSSPLGLGILWRGVFGLGGGLASLLLLTLLASHHAQPVYPGEVGRPMAVILSVDSLEVDSAEIFLPEGRQFYSTRFENVKNLRRLRLPVRDVEGQFPVVIVGVESGTREIKVHFKNRFGELLEERFFQIAFETRET